MSFLSRGLRDPLNTDMKEKVHLLLPLQAPVLGIERINDIARKAGTFSYRF